MLVILHPALVNFADKVFSFLKYSDGMIFFVWALRPVKIISLIFSRVNHKVGREPRAKLPDHPQADLGLSHVLPELGSNPHR